MAHNTNTQLKIFDTQQHALIGLPELMRQAYLGSDLSAIGSQLLSLSGDDDLNAMMDLNTVLQLKGDHVTALALQKQALSIQSNYRLDPATQQSDIRLLALMAPGDFMTNTPIEFLSQGAGVRLEMLYIAPDLPLPVQLPDHDIAIVAVCELDRNRPVLGLLSALVANWPKPVLNKPDRIARMSRDIVCQTLKVIDGVVIPNTIRINRIMLERVGREEEALDRYLKAEEFPIIVRPIDSHAGKGLSKVETPTELIDYLGSRPEKEFFISRYVDYRDSQDQFIKYRVMLVSGRPFVAHMAISDHWMVHYLNAGMTESGEKRDIERQAMSEFDEGFVQRHRCALADIHQRIGVDYFGIDCAETRDGKLLIFEVGSSMVVHAMDPVELYPYKQPQMQKIFNGFHQLLSERLGHFPGRPMPEVLSNALAQSL